MHVLIPRNKSACTLTNWKWSSQKDGREIMVDTTRKELDTSVFKLVSRVDRMMLGPRFRGTAFARFIFCVFAHLFDGNFSFGDTGLSLCWQHARQRHLLYMPQLTVSWHNSLIKLAFRKGSILSVLHTLHSYLYFLYNIYIYYLLYFLNASLVPGISL